MVYTKISACKPSIILIDMIGIGDSTNLEDNTVPERLKPRELKIIKTQIKNLQALPVRLDMALSMVWEKTER